MRYFITRLLIFSIFPAILCCLVILIPANKDDSSYLSSFNDKIEKIKKRKSKSIILIGGSSMAFGVDSKLLEDSLKLPVINLGLQASLGMYIPLNQFLKFSRHGDILIFAPEYSQYLNNNKFGVGSTPAKTVQLLDPTLLIKYNFSQIRQMLPFIMPSALMKIKSYFSTNNNLDSSRNGFNDYGDFIGHLNLPSRTPKTKPHYTYIGKLNSETFEFISNFKEKAKKKGVKVYISFQPILLESAKLNMEVIHLIQTQLNKSGIPILGNPNDYFFNPEFLFEGENHLNRNGRYLRTIQLINDFNKKRSH